MCSLVVRLRKGLVLSKRKRANGRFASRSMQLLFAGCGPSGGRHPKRPSGGVRHAPGGHGAPPEPEHGEPRSQRTPRVHAQTRECTLERSLVSTPFPRARGVLGRDSSWQTLIATKTLVCCKRSVQNADARSTNLDVDRVWSLF